MEVDVESHGAPIGTDGSDIPSWDEVDESRRNTTPDDERREAGAVAVRLDHAQLTVTPHGTEADKIASALVQRAQNAIGADSES